MRRRAALPERCLLPKRAATVTGAPRRAQHDRVDAGAGCLMEVVPAAPGVMRPVQDRVVFSSTRILSNRSGG